MENFAHKIEAAHDHKYYHMNNTYFGAIHFEIHLDMELDYIISRNFQEMSVSDLETLHHLCEIERTQIRQSLALAVLKVPYGEYFFISNRSYFKDYEGNIFWYYTCMKQVSPLYVFEEKVCYKRIPIFYKKKYILSIHSLDEHIFLIQPSHVDLKRATLLYS